MRDADFRGRDSCFANEAESDREQAKGPRRGSAGQATGVRDGGFGL